MSINYYTPTIDEFCLGFEFEYFVRTQTEDDLTTEWVKSKVVLDDTKQAQIKGLTFPVLKDIKLKYYQIGLALKNKTIRVKKLDKDDILSMGFENTEYKGIKCYNINTQFMLYWFDNSNTVSINTVKFNNQLFRGIINNKTELKQIFKFLNININNN